MIRSEARIIFMGTPEFATGILKALLDANYHVAGIVTAPDKPAGREKKIKPPAMKTDFPSNGNPGTIHSDNKTYLHVNTLDNQLDIKNIQAGKRKMDVTDFMKGFQKDLNECSFI